MEDNKNPGNQSRFLLAAALSMVVLLGWSYFFAPKPPADSANANVGANTAANASKTVAATPAGTAQARLECEESLAKKSPELCAGAVIIPDSGPGRKITIKSPLYEVILDSKGAVATSWVLIENRSPKEERPLWADGSTGTDKKPLQLISANALAKDEVPFRLSTGDEAINAVVNTRNYSVAGADDNVVLKPGEEKQIEFTLTDATGVEVTKTFVFRGDNYVADLKIKLAKNGQTVPDTKLLIGASIGDQGIVHHSFYHIESEAIAYVDDSIVRHPGASFTFDANSQALTPAPGKVDWAGVGDAYFAMVAIPSTQTQGLEYHSTKYEFPMEPYYDGMISWVTGNKKTSETRHLITAYVPIASDGSVIKIYTGTKDYFALAGQYSDQISKDTGRAVSLVDLINFSNYRPIRFFTKPIGILILHALNFFNALTRNYGVAIIIFTFLFYSLLFPLRWSQSRSFKKSSVHGPRMKDIQDKIKDLQKKGVPNDDARMRALQMEQIKLTKDALPIGGCLPMLLQFPLLIAFYTAVTVSLDIRQASFIWLPDLSAADPYHILEFAFALSMILSMKFTPQPAAAAATEEQMQQQQMQKKMMTYFMPVMMLWVMWSAPSGLLLYWFFGNIVSFAQQMVINRMNKTDLPPGTAIVNSVPKGAKQVKPKLA